MTLLGLIPFLLYSLIPLVIIIILLIWVHEIKINSGRQVEQNEQIIRLLHDINHNTKNPHM